MPSIPAIAQLMIIFSLIVLAAARKVHLGLAAALGGIALALWRGAGIPAIAASVLGELLNPDTLFLLILMTCIMAFSSAMKKSGAMNAFTDAVTKIAPSPRIALAIAPLIIGTLPMPGGAILSAPLVDAMDSERRRDSGVLAAANYWFRHCFELSWPLYPSFILTASLTGIPAAKLIALNVYAPLSIFTLGLIFVIPPLAAEAGNAKSHNVLKPRIFTRLAAFIAGIAPLALVIGVYIAFAVLWGAVSPSITLGDSYKSMIGRYAPIFIGLVAGGAFIARRRDGIKAFRGCVTASTLKLIATIAGIRIFSALIGEAGLAEKAAQELTGAGIPTIAAVAIVPFVAGLVTGVGFGYVGLAFPIVLGLVAGGGPLSREAAIVLAAAFGYLGMMLSPLHVCMVVSAEHFNIGLPGMYRRFALPLSLYIVIAMGYVALLSAVGL
jgi:integral membrane protein (TIGR00529 family)